MTLTAPSPDDFITSTWITAITNARNMLANTIVARQVPGSSFTSSSATYATITNLNTTSFTKIGASTDSQLLVEVALTAWRSGVAASTTTVGVQIGVVDNDLAALTFNELTSHKAMAGFAYMQALDAGLYTVTPRVKTAAGTFNIDTGDLWCLKISEIPI